MFTTNKFQDFEIREFEVIDSTQEEAKRIIKAKSDNSSVIDNLVIVSNSQTNGKGRGGKGWVSDEGNLFFSVIVNVKRINPPEISSYISALAILHEIKNHIAASVIKWPNDILAEGKKLCGILIEKFGDYLIIGIGININSYPQYLDSGRKACCLNDYTKETDPKKLLSRILNNLQKIISDYNKSGFENIKNEYKKNLYKLNEEIELDYIGKKIKGIIRNISVEGNLVLENNKGMQEYKVGEIFDL